MRAAGIEVMLGFTQGGVFFAVLIYANDDGRGGTVIALPQAYDPKTGCFSCMAK